MKWKSSSYFMFRLETKGNRKGNGFLFGLQEWGWNREGLRVLEWFQFLEVTSSMVLSCYSPNFWIEFLSMHWSVKLALSQIRNWICTFADASDILILCSLFVFSSKMVYILFNSNHVTSSCYVNFDSQTSFCFFWSV